MRLARVAGALGAATPEGTERRSVLFAGQAFYHAWYLSRELRKLGWKADVLNWDPTPSAQGLYHGEDVRLVERDRLDFVRHGAFFARAMRDYDVLHFSNMGGIRFSNPLHDFVAHRFAPEAEIRLAKRLGKKIVYTNNGNKDGVSKTAFSAWGPWRVCDDCNLRDKPLECSDEVNLSWGAVRNELADFQCLLGGNRADFNDDPSVHEVPEFYCMDPELWRPDLLVPSNFRLPLRDETVKIYHAVGSAASRSDLETMRNIKSTHIYLPVIEALKAAGHDVELIFFTDVPNRQVRFYQSQADIVVDMLKFGFFGANIREAMMLGKPAVCFLRSEWLESMRREIPEYVDELPVVCATPDDVYEVLEGLILDPARRADLGRRGREFALKWHSSPVAARVFDRIYSELLAGRDGSAFRAAA